MTDILDIPFKYYNTEQLNQVFNQKNQDLFLHQNIRSLDKHFGKLIALASSIDKPQVICLSEIGKKNLDSRRAQLEHLGYNMVYSEPDKVRGGVALLCKLGIAMEPRPDLEIPKPNNVRDIDLENIWYEATLPNIGKVVIGVIYKHPNSTVKGLKYFRQKLEENMIKINKKKQKCIICGDINIDGMKVLKDTNTKLFFESCLLNNFIPLTTLPSRFQNDICTAIDHIIVNQTLICQTGHKGAGHIFNDISDHLPNFLSISKKSQSVKKKDRKKIRIFGDKNINKFRDKLESKDWDPFFDTNDPNEALQIFYDNYNQAFNSSFPLKLISRKHTNDKDWITPELRKRINYRDKFFKIKTLNPTADNIKRYKKIRNEVNTELDNAEKQYYSKKLNSGKDSLKKLWEIAGTIINPSKLKKQTVIETIRYNGKLINEQAEIADAMNKFFSTIGENLAKKIKTKVNFKSYLQNPNPHSMKLEQTDHEEVIKIILSLEGKKAAGPDGIRPILLKKCCAQLYKQITHLINLSLKTKTVPSQLKIAKVIPIYKKEDRQDPGNYRPISLLSILNKILEKIMYKRLYGFLHEHKILYKYQFGFRKNHSCTQAVIEIVDNILEHINSNYMVAGIYLDLTKAFDTVDHQILLHKMSHYGIRGDALEWTKNYLTNREQYTVANGVCSDKQQVHQSLRKLLRIARQFVLQWVNIAGQLSGNIKRRSLDSQQQRILWQNLTI